MIKMFINWYKAKKIELEMKAMFYGYLKQIIDNQADFLAFLQNLVSSMKGVSADEFRDKLIENMATIIHEDNNGK